MLHTDKTVEVAALEAAFAEANGAARGFAFASAPLAVAALCDLLDGGSHIIASSSPCPDVYRVLGGIKARASAHRVQFLDLSDLSALEAALKAQTRLIWVEPLAGPGLSRPDLGAIVELAHDRDIVVAVDNSALTHAALKPLEAGCDIVFNGAPMLGATPGRGGLVAFSDRVAFAEERFAYLQKAYDGVPTPEQARGLQADFDAVPEIMSARAGIASDLAAKIGSAEFCVRIDYPGTGSGDLGIGFAGTAGHVAECLGRLSHFSAGAVPGLPGTFWHYATRTYEAVPSEIRREMGIADGAVRFAVPAESPADLLAADLAAAFG